MRAQVERQTGMALSAILALVHGRYFCEKAIEENIDFLAGTLRSGRSARLRVFSPSEILVPHRVGIDPQTEVVPVPEKLVRPVFKIMRQRRVVGLLFLGLVLSRPSGYRRHAGFL